ncbi:MAG: hypothetical protein COA79_08760 [Planctomycetota bacterium]|nr:MAG: hypothetical protein COA79_08760 [Planctomycetota bacterium]
MNNQSTEWLRVVSLKYQSTVGISKEKFDELMNKISNNIDDEIAIHDGDYIFPLKIDGVNCMCGIVLLTQDPITECQFTVMTNEGKKPADMYGIEPVHVLMEELFLN